MCKRCKRGNPLSGGECSILFIIIVLLLFELCFGVVELYYLNDSKNYESECYHVWAMILIGCAINLFIFFFSCTIIYCTENSNKIDLNQLIKIQLLQLFPGAWGIWIYYTISNECINVWTEIEQKLLTFVFIYNVLFWIIVPILCILIVTGSIMFCGCLICNNYCPSNKRTSSARSTSQILYTEESRLEYESYV